MRKTVLLAVCVVAPALSGCGRRSALTRPPNPGESLPVIVHLQTRDALITAMAGPAGPVYTVTTRDGRTLGQRLSEQELQVQWPHIHRLLKTSYAESEQRDVIWAGTMVHDP